MQIRRISIKTVDGLRPMPVSSGWVRDGLFVIGMDSEFAVYSQWRQTEQEAMAEGGGDANGKRSSDVDTVDNRHLQDSDLLNIAQVCRTYEFYTVTFYSPLEIISIMKVTVPFVFSAGLGHKFEKN